MLRTLDQPRRLPSEIDLALLWSTLVLLVIGMVMVYSASMATAEAARQTGNQSSYFLIRHGVFLIMALVAAGMAFQVSMATWQRWSPWLFVIGFALLALVLIPGIGREVNGARRWLSLGVVNLQPSELMKLFAVLYAADYTARKMPYMHDLKKAFLPLASAMVAVGVLLLKEPDFGAFVVIISIAMAILFLGGMRARLFVILIVVLAVAFAALIIISPYRRDRIFGFMDPWADAFGRGYQLSHALIAFGRGELFGVGLGASVEKLFYLPEAHTDFLLAVIAEELGFVGVLVVILLFGLLIQRAFAIGRQAVALERYYSALVAQGVGVWLGVQSFINMGVNMGVLPTKGLTLPLMSFGGSGILANCVALAVLLRIDWENRQLMRGAKL
ncbi:MAG: putative peptidoglycan glycosyltransferase FtsW [Accumulibacter sp.]|jgi:cell division protein FtsW|uniref:putative lipid II flippase FtsW n=1 Tax=Accumulibacter sp. TaxID=2053492 RepID=UPI00121C34E3|nr:putative lipid II flippase FtsW [Accumulibacter sp.]QKS27712.1 MAG: putative lipid II flippase FtsW [Candidatus Accumulibacter similis]TLD47025.1 MAG: putative peptidoglycan glycosyltransferase FtsW [Accumulibacter sp.]